MKIFIEKEAEDFLEKEDFRIVERFYLKNESELKEAVKKIGFPLVMKVSGKKIIHKNKINGVKTGIKNYKEALEIFRRFKKKKNYEGVLIQRNVKGEEFLLGIKKTPEFGHVIAFGSGGIRVEEKKKVNFRVCPFDKKVAEQIIKEINDGRKLENKEINEIIKNILKLCKLSEKYPRIKELDINPLFVNSEECVVADARMSWD